MFRQIKSFVLVAIVVGVVMSCSTPALGAPRKVRYFLHGEEYKNETGMTAMCLRKYLDNYEVVETDTSPGSDAFETCEVAEVSSEYKVIQCKVGEVGNNETARVWFHGRTTRDSDGTAEVVCTKWYADAACTVFIDYAYPVASPRPDETETRGVMVDVDIVVRHRAKAVQETGEAPKTIPNTLYGSEIYYAEWQGNLKEEDMTEDLWTCVDVNSNPPTVEDSRIECLSDADCEEEPPEPPDEDPYDYCGRYDDDEDGGIEWLQPGGPTTFTLYNYGDEDGPFDLGTHRDTKRLLFRYYTDLAGLYQQSDYEVVQFRVRDWFIPTVSEWGLVVIALLILAAGTIVIRRRRATAAQA